MEGTWGISPRMGKPWSWASAIPPMVLIMGSWAPPLGLWIAIRVRLSSIFRWELDESRASKSFGPDRFSKYESISEKWSSQWGSTRNKHKGRSKRQLITQAIRYYKLTLHSILLVYGWELSLSQLLWIFDFHKWRASNIKFDILQVVNLPMNWHLRRPFIHVKCHIHTLDKVWNLRVLSSNYSCAC